MAHYSRRQYIEIGKILREAANYIPHGRAKLVVEFIRLFSVDNPVFDEERFITAVGTNNIESVSND